MRIMLLVMAGLMVLLVAGCCHGSHEQQVVTIKAPQPKELQIHEISTQDIEFKGGVKFRIRTFETIRPDGSKVITFKEEALP